MNTKTAKYLRRKLKYHPKEPRKYGRTEGTFRLVPTDPRFQYQEFKKLVYRGEL